MKAIKLAQTEHVVYFMLTAYLAVRVHGVQETRWPIELKRFPIEGKTDVNNRLRVLRHVIDMDSQAPSSARPAIREAIDVFSAATAQLDALKRQADQAAPSGVPSDPAPKQAPFRRAPPADFRARRRAYKPSR